MRFHILVYGILFITISMFKYIFLGKNIQIFFFSKTYHTLMGLEVRTKRFIKVIVYLESIWLGVVGA